VEHLVKSVAWHVALQLEEEAPDIRYENKKGLEMDCTDIDAAYGVFYQHLLDLSKHSNQ